MKQTLSRPLSAPLPAPKSTRHALLEILKREGAQDAKSLAAALGITPMAVGLQLASLVEEKLVAAEPEPARPGKRGRPVHRWALTEAANRVFPDAHALLTADLLGSLQDIYGERGMRKLLDARTRRQEEEYLRAVPAQASLKEKVAALARLRDREGYMTEVEAGPGGGFRLIENHCPICTAARTCQGFCQSEWQVFSRVMGPGAQVAREEHLLSGSRRCVYSISPAKGREPSKALPSKAFKGKPSGGPK
ncbi:MAG TPA: metalloregulator ArsR/SmtB family transcription factor [Fibrobacteria bacterium]|nr:metalloregulator ArsR/SmtB family transcription factor [Fibrobacteria bacterium]